jgi:hypothetical protein
VLIMLVAIKDENRVVRFKLKVLQKQFDAF